VVERFSGRIADALKTHRFNSREDMEQTLLRYATLYNQSYRRLRSRAHAYAGHESMASDATAPVPQAAI
jgi:hypothetical protein